MQNPCSRGVRERDVRPIARHEDGLDVIGEKTGPRSREKTLRGMLPMTQPNVATQRIRMAPPSFSQRAIAR